MARDKRRDVVMGTVVGLVIGLLVGSVIGVFVLAPGTGELGTEPDEPSSGEWSEMQTYRSISGGWSATEDDLTLTVEQVEAISDRFRVSMRASNTNSGSDWISLPPFSYIYAVDDLGNQYQPDHTSSGRWTNVAPGATVDIVMEMMPELDTRATELRVQFSTVLGIEEESDGITVVGIPVP